MPSLKDSLMHAVALHVGGSGSALQPLIDHLIEEGDPHGEALNRAYHGGSIRLHATHPSAGRGPLTQDTNEYGWMRGGGHVLGYESNSFRAPTPGTFLDGRSLAEALPHFLHHAASSDSALHGLANYLEHTKHDAAPAFRKALAEGQVSRDEYTGPAVTDPHGSDNDGSGVFRSGTQRLWYGPQFHGNSAHPLKLALLPGAQSLAAALAAQRSKNQQAKIKALKDLLQHAEEPGSVHATIHHAPETGFVPAATISLQGDGNPVIARYLAAWSGLLQQHPRIVSFHPHPEGADALHTIHVGPGALPTVADSLMALGVNRFLLGSQSAHVYDKGFNKDLGPLVKNLGGSLSSIRGVGQEVGANGPDDHRKAIRAIESKFVGNRGSGGQKVQLAREGYVPLSDPLAEVARAYQGNNTMLDPSTPGGGRARDFTWEEHRDYPLHHFSHAVTDWPKWWADEKEHSDRQYGNEFEDWWAKHPTDDPIVAVKDPDGTHHIWDGFHRVAVSHVLGHTGIPVILGTRKNRPLTLARDTGRTTSCPRCHKKPRRRKHVLYCPECRWAVKEAEESPLQLAASISPASQGTVLVKVPMPEPSGKPPANPQSQAQPQQAPAPTSPARVVLLPH